MPTPEQFLSKRQRYQPISFPQHVSEEEIARDWTLSDIEELINNIHGITRKPPLGQPPATVSVGTPADTRLQAVRHTH